jgi:16S rRNA (cytosine1402-N4)-methyltransferase
LLNETLEYLSCEKKQIVLDCTIGGAGHAEKILESILPGGKLIGIDADKLTLETARRNLKSFKGAFELVNENYRNLDKVLTAIGIRSVDAVLFDLGTSSFQLDEASRGFSFSKSGPLDMRMDRERGVPLWQALRKMGETEIGAIIRDLGQERYWRRIAKAIVTENRISPIKDTLRLAGIVRDAARYWPGSKIDPATRTFQAFRIFINDELNALKEALLKAPKFLSSGGRIVVISFHSLEDRIVKHTFKAEASEKVLKILTKRPIRPGETETIDNPRSRSSKLRAAERV